MEECPVCTLYLRPGVSLAEHLLTHTKELMIQALLKKPTSVQTTAMPEASSRLPITQTTPQMTTAVTYQQILTTNGAGAVVPQLFQVPMVGNPFPVAAGFAPTMYNPMYNPYVPQPYRFQPPPATTTAIESVNSDRDDDGNSEMDMSDSSRSITMSSPIPRQRSPSLTPSSTVSRYSPSTPLPSPDAVSVKCSFIYEEKPSDLSDKTPAINLTTHNRSVTKEESIEDEKPVDPIYTDLVSTPSSSKTIINLDDGLHIFFRNATTGQSSAGLALSPLNIAADESMPARGELSEQESLGADSAWNLFQHQDVKLDPWQPDTTKSFKCSVCGLSFSDIKDRRMHKLTMHSKPGKDLKCPVCGLEFKTIKERRLHASVHDMAEVKKEGLVNSNEVTSSIRQCPTCNAAFETLKDLRIHQRQIHGDIKYKCEECDACFDEDVDYTEHLKIHPLKCRTCGKLFSRRVNLNLHMKRHMLIKPFECTMCPKTFVTRQKLEEHLNGHSGVKPIKCLYCDKTFSRHSNLIQHKNMHHPKCKKLSRDFVCHCGEVYASLRKLEWHKEIHDVKPKSCPYCAQKFIHTASVTRHVRRSHIPNYLPDSSKRDFENVSCPICDRVCLRSSLSVHLRTHNGERPFQCTICSKQFTTKWNMELHQWTHQSRNAMPFKCNQCKSAFFREADYAAHINAHKNLKPFICNVCGQKFIRKYNCLRHQEEHRRSKKFTCSVAGCNRTFHRSYYLKDHMKIHTGVRPHTCHICGKSSSTKSNHNKHVRIHDTRELVNTEN